MAGKTKYQKGKVYKSCCPRCKWDVFSQLRLNYNYYKFTCTCGCSYVLKSEYCHD